MTTKATFLARAEELDVEISEENYHYSRHFHAYSPKGYMFVNTDLHNIGLGNFMRGERPPWDEMIKEIELIKCTEPECEECT